MSSDSPQIREFVEWARNEGWLPDSIHTTAQDLRRYEAFVREHFHIELDDSGWREFVAYRTHMTQDGWKRSTVARRAGSLVSYYRLRAEYSQNPDGFDLYRRVWMSARIGRHTNEHVKPFSPETLHRIMSEAYRGYRRVPAGHRAREDYPLLMTLLYTGGRAQFYGLKVQELDFDEMMIRTTAKGGLPLVIPIHPALGRVLRAHLALRPYRSEFLFRFGRDRDTFAGLHENRQNAYNACQRVKKAAHVDEPVNPQRFRVTLATLGRRLGLDPQVIQALLGHRHLSLTLDIYSRVQPDEAKLEFSKIDLAKDLRKLSSKPRADSTEALLQQIPRDKTEAVNTLLRGIIGLIQSTSLDGQNHNREVQRFRQLLLPRPPRRDRP